MKKKLFYCRRVIAGIVGILCLAAFWGKFYPVRIFDFQLTALLQNIGISAAAAGLLWLAVVVTWGWGRIYCSTVCPLGLFQELLTALFRRKMRPQKNRAVKYFIAAAAFGLLAGGTVCAARIVDPYTLSGQALSGTLFGLAVFLLLAFLVWFKGRCFCTNICPVGALLGLIAKNAVCKIRIDKSSCIACGLCVRNCPSGCIDIGRKAVDNETCVKCLKCLTVCPKNSVDYGRDQQPEKTPAFSAERRRLIIGGAALAVFAAAVRGGAALGRLTAQKVKRMIVPAGAGSAGEFADRCLNCNLCVQNCPMKILKKADGEYPAVHIDYTDGFCDFNCRKCAEVCPSGAIKRIDLAQKQKTRIALAQINERICIGCGLCVMKCPRKTVYRGDDGIVRIDAGGCIGCGTCKAGCPVKAISVVPVEKQDIV